EGASACRREAFLAVGGDLGPLFIGPGGWGLAPGLLRSGPELVYSPPGPGRAMGDPTLRPPRRVFSTFTPHRGWGGARSHPARAAAASITRDLLLMAFTAARAGELAAWARGVADAVRGSRQALRTRRRMSLETARRLALIRAQKPSIMARAVRHARERSI